MSTGVEESTSEMILIEAWLWMDQNAERLGLLAQSGNQPCQELVYQFLQMCVNLENKDARNLFIQAWLNLYLHSDGWEYTDRWRQLSDRDRDVEKTVQTWLIEEKTAQVDY